MDSISSDLRTLAGITVYVAPESTKSSKSILISGFLGFHTVTLTVKATIATYL
ncbi:MAG: hypothetical protein RQ968_01925 [Thermoproteota archaeon]|nr:hypothetical protein [Thermoproteota archaeon]